MPVTKVRSGWNAGDLEFRDTSDAVIATIKSDKTVDVKNADKLTVNAVVVPQHIEVDYRQNVNTNLADASFFIANRAYTVTAVRVNHGVAGSDAGTVTLDVKKATGTQAPASGTTVLSATHNLKATANTVVNLGLSATAGNLDLAAGDRLAVDYTGVLTGVDDVTVTVQLKAK